MAGNLPITNLSRESQDSVIQYFRSCASILQGAWNIRERLRKIDQLYMREMDQTEPQWRARMANRAGDPTKFQNVQVPVVLPAIEAAVTYQSSVFLTGIPLFGVSSAAPTMNAALQLESIIDDQATRGGWIRELQLFLRDGFKYNLAACEVDWQQVKTMVPTTNLAFSRDEGEPTQTIWEGNTLKRLDMYNTIFDPRVMPAEMARKGEFAGYSELVSKIELVKFIQSLSSKMNTKQAYESGYPGTGIAYPYSYYIPQINPESLFDQNLFAAVDWMQWAGLAERNNRIDFKNSYIKTVFYARIQPADFKLASAAAQVPQVYKFVIINGSVLLYAERLTNAHDLIPMLFSQPLEDGLGYQTKSLANNAAPQQEVASALMNSAIQARRRSITDRGIYDPSMINAKDIASDNATAKIPLKPAAFGRDITKAYIPIPFRDEQSQFAMSDMQAVLRFNEMVTGQNQAQQGQFVKGNKTLFEYQDIMANASGRSQNTSILLEAQFFTPLKEILKLNVLQYQKPASVYNRETEQQVPIDPIQLRNAVTTFKVSDGLTPASKQMNTEAFAQACQTLAAVPQLAGAYNLGPMFSYLFKMQRADVGQFEKSQPQIQYEQAVAQWQQTCQMLAETYSKLKKEDGTPYTPADIQAALPPQPLPEQFGFNSTAPQQPQQQGTVMQQFATLTQGNPNAAAQ